MTEHLPRSAELATQRQAGCPFDPTEELTRLREERPFGRLAYPDGHVGWLATSRAAVRAVLADQRFSIKPQLMHMPTMAAGPSDEMPPTPPGALVDMDPPQHTRYRQLLVGKFTVRRMRQLTESVEQITADQLDAMEKLGSPVDLVQAFAQPVPALVICRLLGVPYERREEFQHHAMTATGGDGAEVFAAFAAVQEIVGELVQAKRAAPTDDLLSDLTSTDLTDEELANIGAVLLGAGLDTTANMLALGTFALLSNPDQLARLRDDPGIADQAVEELLRYLSIIPSTVRTALEDVEVNGQLIRAGDTVMLSLQAANRDPAQFADADVLDLHRSASGQVAFGHGIHQCLGQQLARVEMRVAFPALVTRFPTLRMGVAPEDVRMREGSLVYGVHELPVEWDQAS